MIERSVRILKENGITNVIIGTGYLSEHYENLARQNGLKTFKNPKFDSTGSFHTLACGRDLIASDFLLLESDLLYHSEAIKKLIESEERDQILCSGFTQSNDEVFVEVGEGLLKNLSKDRHSLGSVDAELVGIWKISLDLYHALLQHHEDASDATSKDYEIAITNSNYPVNVLKLENLIWCEIDNEEHLKRAKTEILPKLS